MVGSARLRRAGLWDSSEITSKRDNTFINNKRGNPFVTTAQQQWETQDKIQCNKNTKY
jgi:hypothetical protein